MRRCCLMLLILCLVCGLFAACASQREQYIRIHIRANSDNIVDQEVKLAVKDSVVNFLSPLAHTAKDKEQMMQQMTQNLQNIKKEAEKVLGDNNMSYSVNVRLEREMFPQKTYGELTLEAGEYDALIVELGSGEGSNWWCVAFPPLCFIPSDEVGEEIVYKSKIKEWITKIFNLM